MDFWSYKIFSTPEETFTASERLYLWDYDGWQAVLTFKNWEFRVYTYNYNDSEDSWEDEGWAWLNYEFENFFWSYEEWTLGYVVVESSDEDEILDIIDKTCKADLGYYSPFARDELPWFIKKRIEKTNKYIRAYSYYK